MIFDDNIMDALFLLFAPNTCVALCAVLCEHRSTRIIISGIYLPLLSFTTQMTLLYSI